LFCFRIYFAEAKSGFQLGCGLLENRGKSTAGSTPGRPEIHDDGDIVLLKLLLKIETVDFYRMSIEERFLTTTAIAVTLQLFGRQPVSGIAVRANDMQGLAHCVSPGSGSKVIVWL
jgi:hypothetical protein